MRIHPTAPLFAWGQLEDRPCLRAIRDFLQAVPDQPLLDGLTAARGAGRNDFPVAVLWGVVLLTALLRHPSFEATLAELHRNPSLCRLLGILDEEDIPHDWNVSRFLDALGCEPHLTRVRRVFDALVQRLGRAVPDLGRHTAGDATHLSARARKGEQALAAEAAQGLPQPAGGKKEYKDADGNVTRVVTWYGYKLHLLVDVRHEVTLAYRVSAATAGDNEHVAALAQQALANLPEGRIETLAYDKAADDSKVHEALAEQGIKPVIRHQAHWPKQGEQEKVLGGRVPLNVVYDEAGRAPGGSHCYGTTSDPPVRQPRACIGYEKGRQALKYRCPARHHGWDCPSDSRCNAGKKRGLAVRIDCTKDWRRFPPIPRATQQFERRYKGRTASERVNARLKLLPGCGRRQRDGCAAVPRLGGGGAGGTSGAGGVAGGGAALGGAAGRDAAGAGRAGAGRRRPRGRRGPGGRSRRRRGRRLRE
jgi:hypothetical protein